MKKLFEAQGESLSQKKAKVGEVKFPTSTLTDPFMQKMMGLVAQHHPKINTAKELSDKIEGSIEKMNELSTKAPILYDTMKNNVVENDVFSMFMEADVPSNAPKFSTVTFNKLVRTIRASHDEFFPLRSFVDKRQLINPMFDFVDIPMDAKGVTTAAATPGGKFIFNVLFMQKLMDYANLKGIKPQSKKYKSNGGPFPDEYAYIEFLIMHEFMHYSNDDFYYQKIIPGASNQIINWVGDFRSNYLLTKSGFEPLPIGLFNDSINYDRQKEYIEMYKLVKSEFDNLNDDEKDDVSDRLDGLSDDHEPGQEEGEESDADVSNIEEGDIDQNSKRIQKEMDAGEDTDEMAETKKKDDDSESKGNEPGDSKRGGRGSGDNPQGIDYDKIKPTFNWKAIIKRTIMSGKPKFEETYAKPHRRSITGGDIMAQTGASAIKPAEKKMDESDIKVAMIIDSSGSMSSIISTVFSNAVALLSMPQFKKSVITVYKFSNTHEVFKVNFARNKAEKVSSVNDKPKNMNMNANDVFSKHFGAGTTFNSALANDVKQALDQKYNVICFLDSDILYGKEYDNFMSVVTHNPKQVFVVFDSRDTYINFRKKGGATQNMTYFD